LQEGFATDSVDVDPVDGFVIRARVIPMWGKWKSVWIIFFISLAAILVGWNIGGSRVPRDQNIGVTVRQLKAQDLEGHVSMITPARSLKPIVLYIFNPDCHWCELNLRNIKSLADKEGNSFLFIGLSLPNPKLKGYIASSGIDFPVYKVASYNVLSPIAVYGTPQTVVILHNGTVDKNWTGAYSGAQRKAVESYFSVKLPGLVTHGQ
jgi:hypothetical protein